MANRTNAGEIYLKSLLSDTSPVYSGLNQRDNPDFILNDTSEW